MAGSCLAAAACTGGMGPETDSNPPPSLSLSLAF